MKTFKLHLIRHGLTSGNLQGLYIGSGTDIPLCDEGRAQLAELKERFEYPQVDTVFSSPLMRAVETANILFPNATHQFSVHDLREAGFGERLDRMPEGLETSLYQDFDKAGMEISGGEAQKIALARALYKNAPFIVLDEPTAALDPVSEYEVYRKFNEISGGRTAVYISHRLASCRFCDEILVFHEGQIVQHGAHEALLAESGGKYAELWNAQAQYYTDAQAGAEAEA